MDIAKTYRSQLIALAVSCIPLSIKLSSTGRLQKWHENNVKEAKEWLKDIFCLSDENKIEFRLEVLETTSSVVRTIVEYAEQDYCWDNGEIWFKQSIIRERCISCFSTRKMYCRSSEINSFDHGSI